MGIGEKTPLLASRSSSHRRVVRHTNEPSHLRPSVGVGRPIQRNASRQTGCHCGTYEGAGIWWSKDLSGSFMALSVWIAFSVVIATIISRTTHLLLGAVLCTTTFLALASHAKTAMTDPGTVPRSAIVRNNAYCALCQVGKPAYAHHCRTCRRCICRMDHHCPWVKNCIGAANMKHFVLFLIYTWISCMLALIESVYLEYLVGLLFSVFGLSFVTYILSHTVTSIWTGLGAIDRLQGKRDNRGLRLVDIFGSNFLLCWFPVDPHFRDPEKIFGYMVDDQQYPSRVASRSPNRAYQTRRWEFPAEAIDI